MEIFIKERFPAKSIIAKYDAIRERSKIDKLFTYTNVHHARDTESSEYNKLYVYMRKYAIMYEDYEMTEFEINNYCKLNMPFRISQCLKPKVLRSYLLCRLITRWIMCKSYMYDEPLMFNPVLRIWQKESLHKVREVFGIVQSYMYELFGYPKYRKVAFESVHLIMLLSMNPQYNNTLRTHDVLYNEPNGTPYKDSLYKYGMIILPFAVSEIKDADEKEAESYVRELFGNCDYSYWQFKLLIYMIMHNYISKYSSIIFLVSPPDEIVQFLQYLVSGNSTIIKYTEIEKGIPEFAFNTRNHKACYAFETLQLKYPAKIIDTNLIFVDCTRMKQCWFRSHNMNSGVYKTPINIGKRELKVYKHKIYIINNIHMSSLQRYKESHRGNYAYYKSNPIFIMFSKQREVLISESLSKSLCKWALGLENACSKCNSNVPAVKKYNKDVGSVKKHNIIPVEEPLPNLIKNVNQVVYNSVKSAVECTEKIEFNSRDDVIEYINKIVMEACCLVSLRANI